jgi:5-methylcytosine-specific restriction endonuclease McrA
MKCYRIGSRGKPATARQMEILKRGRLVVHSNKGSHWNGESRKKVSGKNSHRWEGGKTTEHAKIRNSFEMRVWKRQILERDDFTCQVCHTRGGKLRADHIKPFSLYPELRLDLNNGRTICLECDFKSLTYGGRAKKYETLAMA